MPTVHTYTENRYEWRQGRLQRYPVAGDNDMKERKETSGRGKTRRALTREPTFPLPDAGDEKLYKRKITGPTGELKEFYYVCRTT